MILLHRLTTEISIRVRHLYTVLGYGELGVIFNMRSLVMCIASYLKPFLLAVFWMR